MATKPRRRKKPGAEMRQRPPGIKRLRVYASSIELGKAIQDYFLWVQENPVKMKKIGMTKTGWDEYSYTQPRAMTIEGLCAHIGIVSRLWRKWRDERDDLQDLVAQTEDIIFAQKFEYAALDVFNASLIARSLNLADRQEVSGPEGKPVEYSDVSPRERLASKLNGLAARAAKTKASR